MKIKLAELLEQMKKDRTAYKECVMCKAVTTLDTAVCKLCDSTEFKDISDETIAVGEAFIRSIKESKLIQAEGFELEI